ncbi:unnamed protein product [Victoria cruziana]
MNSNELPFVALVCYNYVVRQDVEVSLGALQIEVLSRIMLMLKFHLVPNKLKSCRESSGEVSISFTNNVVGYFTLWVKEEESILGKTINHYQD